MANEEELLDHLKWTTGELRTARRRLREHQERGNEPVAVVAMSCRFAGGVDSPEALWRLVEAGGDAIGGLPADRGWNLAALRGVDPEKPAASSAWQGGFIDSAADFAPAFFGIAPSEALAMDPQQRLLLELSWEALERAGIDPLSRRGSRTGVYIGANGQNYSSFDRVAQPKVEAYVVTGMSTSVMSGRISYLLGLEGPAVTVDTACSASLVSLHLAAAALRNDECDLALAGGSMVIAEPGEFVGFSRLNALAKDGRCKAFAEGADGMGLAEGAGLLVLERLSEAKRNGHPVLALIRGSALNQDGASSGLTAPNGPAQQRVIRAALDAAGLTPDQIDAVEAHGTGTKLGDPIEAQALLATYGHERSGESLWLGSVKSNIGHTQAAAGVAGVIKMVEALRRGVLPKTLHVAEPTSEVPWSSGGVALLTENRKWPETGRPRRAGVSAFGMSGTNAHLLLEQALDPSPGPTSRAVPAALPFVLSTREEAALPQLADRLLARVRDADQPDPLDLAYSLITTRSSFPYRRVVVATSREDLERGLRELVRLPAVPVPAATTKRKVAFVFPGQGSQWAGMARDLMAFSPVFARRMDECAVALEPFVDWSLSDVLGDEQALERVDVVQPALFAVMVSLAEFWRSSGVEPAAVIGHSQGEIAAAVFAGGLSLEDGARVVALRSKVIAGTLAGRGGMLSVALPASRVRESMANLGERVSVAAVNGPTSTVVSGAPRLLDELAIGWADAGVRTRRIPVDYASHCYQVEDVSQQLIEELLPIQPKAAHVPMFSTVTSNWLDTEQADGGYWFRNLRETVRFEEAISALAAEGFDLFIECSAHPVLTFSMQETIDAVPSDAAVLGSLHRDDGGPMRMLTSLGEAFGCGAPVRWAALFDGTDARPTDLPTYPFQRQRYWWDDEPTTGRYRPSVEHPFLETSLDLADNTGSVFTGQLSFDAQPWLADHTIGGLGLLPGTAFLELALHVAGRAGLGALKELTLETPLVVSPEVDQQVQVVLGPIADDRTRAFTVYSHSEGPWSRHASGVLGPAVPAPSAEFGAWPPPGAEPVEVSGHYAWLAEHGYTFGPAFQGLRKVWRRGRELFAEVRLPDAQPTGGFGVHPALLDSVLHALSLGDVVDEISRNPGEKFLPFTWNGAQLYRSGARILRARLTPDRPDSVVVSVTDELGRPALSIDSIVLRPVTTEQLAIAGNIRHNALYTVQWQPAPIPSADTGEVAILGADDLRLAAAGLRLRTYPSLDALAAGGLPDSVFVTLGAGTDDVPQTAHTVLAAMLELIQTWLADERFAGSRLVLVTREAVTVGATDEVRVGLAPLWGLIRAVQTEHPRRFVLVDIDGSEDSAAVVPVLATGGEPQLAVRAGRAFVPRLTSVSVTEPKPLSTGGCVLITGGTGTLGAAIARHLITTYRVEKLLLASRRGPKTPGCAELMAELEGMGAEVVVVACDAGDRSALARLLDEHPVTGIVHAAGVTDDALITKLEQDSLKSVLRSKVDGAWYLHELTRERDLDFFVLFSSVAGLLGSPGQANYAAANGFLDALAEYRTAQGLSATSIEWGLWAQTSELTGKLSAQDRLRAGRNGILPMPTVDCLALFDAALDAEQAVLAGVWLDRVALASATTPSVLLSGLVPPRPDGVAPAVDVAGQLASLDVNGRDEFMLELVCDQVATVMGLSGAVSVPSEEPFKALGLDSLTAVELRNRLGAATGLRLPTTVVFDYPTPRELAAYLGERLAPAAIAPGSFESELASLEAAIGALTGADIERVAPDEDTRDRLSARLRGLVMRWGSVSGVGEESIADRFESTSDDDIFDLIDRRFGKS